MTSTPGARDQQPQWSPDGKLIAFVSDQSGREELYVAPADASTQPQKITDLDALKFNFAWSPSSKEIAFTASDDRLRKYNVDSKQTTELIASKYGNIGAPVWSPDGRWIAYSKPDYTRTQDIFLISAAGGDERKVTFDSASDINPRFTHDGRKLYFVRTDAGASVCGRSGDGVLYLHATEAAAGSCFCAGCRAGRRGTTGWR